MPPPGVIGYYLWRAMTPARGSSRCLPPASSFVTRAGGRLQLLDHIPQLEDDLEKLRLFLHLRRRAIGGRDRHLFQNRAGRGRDDVGPVAEVHRFLDRVRHEEHRRLQVAPEVDQQILHSHPGGRIERAEWFVHQNDSGPQDQRARDRDALSHAAGQLRWVLLRVARRIESDFTDPFERLLAPDASRNAPALEPEADVFLHRPVLECRVVLEHHAPVRSRPRDGLAGHEHAAGGRGKLRPEAGDEAQDGGFPAPRRPEDRDELALARQILDPERDVLDRREAVVVRFRHALELDDRRPDRECGSRLSQRAHTYSDRRRYGNSWVWNHNSRRSIAKASSPMIIRIKMMCSVRPRRWLVLSR